MKRLLCCSLLVLILACTTVFAEESDNARLAEQLGPIWSCLSGQREAFTLSAKVTLSIDGKPQQIEAQVSRYDDHSFDLELKHPEYEVILQRRADITALALPKYKVSFMGRGAVEASNHLACNDIAKRLVSQDSAASSYVLLLDQPDTKSIAALITGLLGAKHDAKLDIWKLGDSTSLAFTKAGRVLDIAAANATRIHLEVSDDAPQATPLKSWPTMEVVKIERRELERTLARGASRACEVLAPSLRLSSPPEIARTIEHGSLQWIGGQRVVSLHGTPEQIGEAHGKLLQQESQRCIDSVLYAFGTVQTIRNGRWFRHDLEAAYERLSPHIPADHKLETQALAKSLDLEPRLVETLNVFPELFHCSGFALFGTATVDGKLYHGRVLDYMTTIGLQDSATTFIVAVDGKIPFANVGYAGFIGSVSGMNDQAISLGEMGGRGEGKWDGAPMATLMRRALEECRTLDDVMTLWRDSPRTCEYYYVFADGKTNRAVGVAATPESIEFIQSGQGHERLGEGIADAVVLSAGDRLTELRKRVTSQHGRIDVAAAQNLMCRPVAMESNLHNVLFVPADGVLYVANANHEKPAAERPYVKLDLKQLLKAMKK